MSLTCLHLHCYTIKSLKYLYMTIYKIEDVVADLGFIGCGCFNNFSINSKWSIMIIVGAHGQLLNFLGIVYEYIVN